MNKNRFIQWGTTHPNLTAALLLLTTAIALMSPYLLQPDAIMWPRSELGTDLLTYNWPSVDYFKKTLQTYGQIPLWQSSSMSGLPMIGNPAIRVFYLPQFLLSLLPIPILWMFALLNTLHFWIAGLGGYGLARSAMGLSRQAAFIGGLLMMLTPRLSSNIVGDLGYTYGLCWIPLWFLFTRLALDRRSCRWAILAGAALSCIYMTNIQFILYAGWLLFLYFAYKLILSFRSPFIFTLWIKNALTLSGLTALILALFAAFSAYQLFPFITFLPHQSREAMTLQSANYLALPPALLINAFIPTSFKFPEWELYVGVLPLILAPLAILNARRRETWFWLGLVIFSVLFSLGSATPLYTLMFYGIPGFGYLRVPTRMWYFAAFAAAMLVSLAVDYILQAGKFASRWWRWLVVSGGLLIVITLAGRYLTRRPDEMDWLLGFLAAVSVIIGLLGLGQFGNNRLTASQFAGLLIAGLCLDLFPLDVAFARPRPSAEVFELPEIGKPVVEQAQVEQFRIYGIRREFADHIVVTNQLEAVEGLNSFQFATYSQFMRLASGCYIEGIFAAVPPCASNEISPTAYLDAKPDPTLLGLLNVKYVISPFELPDQSELKLVETTETEWLYENSAVLPRAFGVGRVEIVENEQAVWVRLPQVDLRTTAVIESSPSIDTSGINSEFFEPGVILSYTPNQIHVRINMPDNGMLIFSEVWTPGWQASVDGEEGSVLRINGTLRGVMLDGGEHDVRLYFMPPAFVTGLIVTILTLVGGVVALFWSLIRRRVGRVQDIAEQ
jgi:Bacterial membrane protein YfhO